MPTAPKNQRPSWRKQTKLWLGKPNPVYASALMKPSTTFQVYLLQEPHPPKRGDIYERVCTLYDGYAGFFVPLFDSIKADYGRDIVFANGVTFGKEDLNILFQLVRSARNHISQKGQSWEVLIGFDNKKKPMHCKVTKEKMSLLVDEIHAACKKAKSIDGYVSFNFWGNGG